jgi:hypothetical protein
VGHKQVLGKKIGGREMSSRPSQYSARPTVTIRVSGKLFNGHLSYLSQLVVSAAECQLWPLLSLAHLEELDRAALLFLIHGEDREFGVISCPAFIREWMDHEKQREAA